MKILYIHRTQGKGVEGVHIYETIKALCKLGHNVTVVSPAGVEEYSNSKTVDELAPSYAKASVGKSCEYQTRGKGIFKMISKYMPEMGFELAEILYNFIADKKISKILNEKNYDFIYERYAIFNWAGVKVAKKNNIPIILEINYTSYTPLYRKRNKLLKPLAHWIDKRIFGRANGFIVVSTYLKNHLVELGVPSEKIVVLTNAADPDRFNPNIKGDKIRQKYNLQNKKVIGFSGGFYPWHGLDLLFDCFVELNKEIKEISLFLIGEGPLKSELETKTRNLGLQDRVIFTDQIPHDKLPEYIATFDIAVMPDSNNYGSPMKIFEYMALGKPTVAPRLSPLEDVIKDGENGILFEQGNIVELANCIKKLLDDNVLYNKISKNAKNNILKNHLWKNNAEKVIEVYKGLKLG